MSTLENQSSIGDNLYTGILKKEINKYHSKTNTLLATLRI